MQVQSTVLFPYRYRAAPLSALQVTAQAKTVAYGPVAIGDIREGIQSTLWGGYVDASGRVFLGQQTEGVWSDWTERFTLIDPVASITLTFDFDGYPMIAFVRKNGTYGVWLRVEEDLPQLFNLGTLPSRFTVLCFAQTTDEPAYSEFADIILAFGDGGALHYRLASEGFSLLHQLSITQSYERVWVARSGLNEMGRFQITMKG